MKMLNESLRLMRVLHDLSAKELAERLEISVAKLSKIENGIVDPQYSLLEKYAQVFNTTPTSLLLFAESLDEEKKRGKFKVSIRNTMFKLLQALEGAVDVDKKNPVKK